MPQWRVLSAADLCACRQEIYRGWKICWGIRKKESKELKEWVPSECFLGQVNGWKGRAMLEGQLDRKGGAVASITGALGAGRGHGQRDVALGVASNTWDPWAFHSGWGPLNVEGTKWGTH